MTPAEVQILLGTLDHTRNSLGWVVVVSPNEAAMMQVRRVLSAAVGKTELFSGRTATLKHGGRLSSVAVTEQPFLPEGRAFSVLFLGHWGDVPKEKVAAWETAASGVLSRG